MKNIITAILFLLSISIVHAQESKKEKDIEAIKSMAGCYNVSFNFAETFSPKNDYEFHDNYHSGAIELVLPIELTDDKIVLQHLLVIGDTMVIKHWRQDWVYENQNLYQYEKNNTWAYKKISEEKADGTWTQKVYQVDDGPRYEGSATWSHIDGRHFWENKSDAPLPRREITKRHDYNVMKRRNHHEITEKGWVHEQDNEKIVRSESGDEILASEKGWNIYTKVDDENCKIAKEWWNENKVFWGYVRDVWGELFDTKQTLAFETRVDDQFLFQRLFALSEEPGVMKEENAKETKEKIRAAIQAYLKGDIKFAELK